MPVRRHAACSHKSQCLKRVSAERQTNDFAIDPQISRIDHCYLHGMHTASQCWTVSHIVVTAVASPVSSRLLSPNAHGEQTQTSYGLLKANMRAQKSGGLCTSTIWRPY
eukprot:5249813-Pleurochrysis_carterae.AAC.1